MSWKGFKKAIARLPQQVTRGSDAADLDPDTLALISEFEQLEALVTRLRDDVAFVKKSLSGYLTSQHDFIIEFMSLQSELRPSGTLGTEESDNENPTLARASYSDHSLLLHIEQLKLSFDGAFPAMQDALSVLDTGVLTPCNEMLAMFKNVRKFITKREHKQIDYERHKSSVDRLRTMEKRDEPKLLSAETALSTAQQEHALVNSMLREQLPEILAVRVSFVKPCYASFVYTISQVSSLLSATYRPIANKLVPNLKPSMIVQQYESRRLACETTLAELSLLQGNPVLGVSSSAPNIPASATANSNTNPNSSTQLQSHFSPPPPPYASQDGNLQSKDAASYQPTYTVTTKPIMHSGSAATAAAPKPTNYTGFKIPLQEQNSSSATTTSTNTTTNTTATAAASISNKRVIALFDFDAVEATDLSFKRGDMIVLIDSNDDRNSWWRGRCNGREGMFPGNYTQDM